MKLIMKLCSSSRFTRRTFLCRRMYEKRSLLPWNWWSEFVLFPRDSCSLSPLFSLARRFDFSQSLRFSVPHSLVSCILNTPKFEWFSLEINCHAQSFELTLHASIYGTFGRIATIVGRTGSSLFRFVYVRLFFRCVYSKANLFRKTT